MDDKSKDVIKTSTVGKTMTSPVGGRRKKRSASGEVTGKECPKKFARISEELCLHYHEVESTFESSKAYCERMDSELFTFTDSSEATKVWNWLGNYFAKKI